MSEQTDPTLSIQMSDDDINLTISVTAGVSVVYDAVEALTTVLRGFGYLESYQSLRILTDTEGDALNMSRANGMLEGE